MNGVRIVVVAACALVDADGRVLVARRPEGKAMAGLWEFPGGKVDPTYHEADVVPHMAGRDINIMVDVGVGKGRATVWTCDLTHRYIDINGSYRS